MQRSKYYKARGKLVYLVLPYGGRKTKKLKEKIKILIKNYYPQIDFNFIFKTPKSIGDLYNFKDQIQPLMR